MYELSNDDPLVRSRRPFDPNRPSGSEITVGNIAKIAEAAAENRAALVKLEAEVAKLEAMVAEGLTKLDARVLVADAINKIRAEDARREVEARHAMAFAKANVTPAEFAAMARRNGWPA